MSSAKFVTAFILFGLLVAEGSNTKTLNYFVSS